ncbi:MAG: hypothetical protein GY705_32000 [Bacteroidetes bacterium]|nr:hypothetical protein [Bacteroidota bacterium]
MLFPLQYIESNVSEHALLHGEQLLEKGVIKNLREVEKHFWLAQLEYEDLSFEVEVQISPSKVVAFSCECTDYQKAGICGHIVATLLELRSRLDNIKNRKKNALSNPSSKKLTTSLILEQIDSEELIRFLKQYARANRNFALALKTRFASAISIEPGREKYSQLLGSAINSARKKNRRIGNQGSTKISKILDELLFHIEDTSIRKHYVEAFHIIRSIIEKIPLILSALDYNREEIKEKLRTAFSSLNRIVQMDIAPDLKEDVWAYCFEECQKLIYASHQLEQLFFKILLTLANDDQKIEELLQINDYLLEKYRKIDLEEASLIILKFNVLEKSGKDENSWKFIKRHLNHRRILNFAIYKALSKDNYPLAKQLAERGLVLYKDERTKAKLNKTLYRIALATHDKKYIASFAKERLLQKFDPDFFQLFKENCEGNWEAAFEGLIYSIQQGRDKLGRALKIAALYKAEKRWDDLIVYIEKMESLDLLKWCGKDLIEYDHRKAYPLYEKVLFEHLRNHLGRQTSIRIRDIIYQLYSQKAGAFANKLVTSMRTSFPERHSLIEELSDFKVI